MPDTSDRILQFTVRAAEQLGYRVHWKATDEHRLGTPSETQRWILVAHGLSRLGQARHIASILLADPRTDWSGLPAGEQRLLGLDRDPTPCERLRQRVRSGRNSR
ncbi:MAG TPA: hypothetical protein VIY86_03880 [Pirellulaceae bacterium]